MILILKIRILLLEKLTQTNSHLAAARTRCSDYHQRTCRLHIIIAAKAFLRVNEGDIVGIAFNDTMVIHLDAHTLQTLAIGIGAGLTIIMGHHNGVHHETTTHKLLTETEHIHIVGDTQVATHLVLLNVDGADDDNDFRHINQL